MWGSCKLKQPATGFGPRAFWLPVGCPKHHTIARRLWIVHSAAVSIGFNFGSMIDRMLRAVDPERVTGDSRTFPGTWGHETAFPQSALEGMEAQLALIGVPGTRDQAGRDVPDGGTDRIRRALYGLAAAHNGQRVADLGDIIPGRTPRDTRAALREVAGELLERGVVPVVFGGGQELTHALYEAYEARSQSVNLVSVDAFIDLIDRDEVNARTWMWHVLDREPSWLFNYTHIGYQSHFISPDMLHSMDRLHFEHLRLGQLRDNLRQVEPAVRDADLLSFDLVSVRGADFSANSLSGPNGLTGEEACQIARYAGLSDKLSCFGLFGYEPDLDRRGLGAALAAQMIWYFVDGFYNRKNDTPHVDSEDYIRYRVTMEQDGYELSFLKSGRSGRWWMEVPYRIEDGPEQEERHALLPCSYEDYQLASRQEIPDRWLRALNRFNV